jgi:glycosyltransferase involved in cell wall biosynthesis
MNKKKLLVIHPALAPYRVDFFNSLAQKFESVFYFNLTNVADQKFNQDVLKKECNFKCNYLSSGFEAFGRSFRFGTSSIIKKESPDIVLCSEFGPVTSLVFLYRVIFRKSFKLYTICDDSIDNSISRKGFRSLLRNIISRNIDGIIFSSDEVCNWYSNNISNKTKTLVLPIIHKDQIFRARLEKSLAISNKNINDYDLLGKKVILYVGRLVKVKNLKFLLRVFSKLINSNGVLVLVGDGELNTDLRELVTRLNIDKNVLFVGRKEGVELVSWYNLGQIFVLPSKYEPFGAVINEALLGGCKVLCSELAGASSLVNSSNGETFNPSIEVGLFNLLTEYLDEIKPISNEILEIRKNMMPFSFDEKVAILLENL